VHAGSLGQAVAAFEAYLARESDPAARRQVAGYLDRLRRQIN
jgi:hypothetical protein